MSEASVKRRNRRSGAAETGRRWQEVIDTAACVFFESGYESASINDISAALSITKGSLYHYVQTKEDLLYAIIREMHVLNRENLRRAVDSEGPALTRLHDYFVGHARTNIDHLEKSSVIYRDLRHLSARRRREIVRLRDDVERFVRDLLSVAVEEGAVCRLLDPHLASIEMFSTVNAIYQWYRPTGEYGAAEVATSMADFVLAAVACRGDGEGSCFRHAGSASALSS